MPWAIAGCLMAALSHTIGPGTQPNRACPPTKKKVARAAARGVALYSRMATLVAPLAQAVGTTGAPSSLTLPVLSVFEGAFTRAVHTCLGDGRIDLWVPYFCVSTSVSRCRAVHTRGHCRHTCGPPWRCAAHTARV